MHEYICMMASIGQTADRLWPDMTAQRLVTWQPTMLVSNTKITSATQRSWIVASYNVHSVTFAVCWHFSWVHTFVLTYLCNLRPPQMLAERTLRWDLVFRDLFTCSLPPPNGVQYGVILDTLWRSNRPLLSLYIHLARGIFVIRNPTHLYVVRRINFHASWLQKFVSAICIEKGVTSYFDGYPLPEISEFTEVSSAGFDWSTLLSPARGVRSRLLHGPPPRCLGRGTAWPSQRKLIRFV